MGIACPVCKCEKTEVIHTRKTETGVVRERVCRQCGAKKILTFESILSTSANASLASQKTD